MILTILPVFNRMAAHRANLSIATMPFLRLSADMAHPSVGIGDTARVIHPESMVRRKDVLAPGRALRRVDLVLGHTQEHVAGADRVCMRAESLLEFGLRGVALRH